MDKIMAIKNKVRINEWSEMVKTCRSSGLTVQQWCSANGINIKTYYYRLKKVKRGIIQRNSTGCSGMQFFYITFCHHS